MMTIEELNRIKAAKEELVMVRSVIREQGEILAQKTGYRKQVLVCGGTGCTSSGSTYKVPGCLCADCLNGFL